MKINKANRPQLEAIARRLGISSPQLYNVPELRDTVKARYYKLKREGKI